jgi:hypothetical protein
MKLINQFDALAAPAAAAKAAERSPETDRSGLTGCTRPRQTSQPEHGAQPTVPLDQLSYTAAEVLDPDFWPARQGR